MKATIYFQREKPREKDRNITKREGQKHACVRDYNTHII